ncbi:MAG: ParB/RepB/Spo0J family partition protein [Candidatus Falkowbacteria bacterium]|nr:ParB/RepB/Spo0J family partition protein [Candidatus Falkowbacteria bacterium]
MPQGLGRGLGSLIPKKTFSDNDNYSNHSSFSEEPLAILSDKDRIRHLDPSLIVANPHQPRRHFSEESLRDLMESIRQHGILQPIVVTKSGDKYELIAGERRLRSIKALGLSEIPAIVREADEQKKLEWALIENLQRENLNSVETAIAYRALIDQFNLTQEELAKRVGKARSSVANALRFLSLPEEIQRALADGRISEGHAKYLLGIEDEAQQLNIFKKILRQNWTVSETDRMIKQLGGTKAAKIKTNNDQEIEADLRSVLGTKVEIRRHGRGGQVMVYFYSDEELKDLTNKLKS